MNKSSSKKKLYNNLINCGVRCGSKLVQLEFMTQIGLRASFDSNKNLTKALMR